MFILKNHLEVVYHIFSFIEAKRDVFTFLNNFCLRAIVKHIVSKFDSLKSYNLLVISVHTNRKMHISI